MPDNECLRIADQLRRAFEGEAWHGPSVSEAVSGVSAEQASAHPLAGAHSIFELVLHIEAWVAMARAAISGVAFFDPTPADVDWPAVKDSGSAGWAQAVTRLFATANGLGTAIEQLGDGRLRDRVPGREYDFYFLFHGVVQHSLYHAGQIVLLKKALAGRGGA